MVWQLVLLKNIISRYRNKVNTYLSILSSFTSFQMIFLYIIHSNCTQKLANQFSHHLLEYMKSFPLIFLIKKACRHQIISIQCPQAIHLLQHYYNLPNLIQLNFLTVVERNPSSPRL